MSKPASSDVTTLLAELRRGDEQARDQLVTLVYPELKRIAVRYLREERPDHTLRPTGLVHEVYLRLFGSNTRAGRTALTSSRRSRVKCGICWWTMHVRETPRNAPMGMSASRCTMFTRRLTARDEDLVALDEALSRLERIDPRVSRVVELRFFTGLGERETAEALKISLATLKRDWSFAKAWLFDQLSSTPAK